jgi:hypothetical protein
MRWASARTEYHRFTQTTFQHPDHWRIFLGMDPYSMSMGLYDTLVVEDGIDLPKFPPDRRPSEIEWQTKEIGCPYMKTYKLTAAGELLRKEQDRREKTAAEKSAEADEHGFNSWEDYRSFCENADSQELLDRGLGLAGPTEQTVATEFWLNHNMHGSFEFHGKHDAIEAGFHWSYEARFTKGDLDAIVFLGERGGEYPEAFRTDSPDIVRF